MRKFCRLSSSRRLDPNVSERNPFSLDPPLNVKRFLSASVGPNSFLLSSMIRLLPLNDPSDTTDACESYPSPDMNHEFTRRNPFSSIATPANAEGGGPAFSFIVLDANVGGASPEDFVTAVERLEEADEVDAYELNLSCPNVQGGKLLFSTTTQMTEEAVSRTVAASDVPVFAKLSPNVTDIREMARVCEAEGADGVSLINAVQALEVDVERRRPVLAARLTRWRQPSGIENCLRSATRSVWCRRSRCGAATHPLAA